MNGIIIGAGIGGLTTAIALGQKGFLKEQTKLKRLVQEFG